MQAGYETEQGDVSFSISLSSDLLRHLGAMDSTVTTH